MADVHPAASPPPVATLLDLTGHTALVTGAGSGIGTGIALRLAEAGASVIVHFHSSEEGARAVTTRIVRAGGRAVPVQADLANAHAVDHLLDDAAGALALPRPRRQQRGHLPARHDPRDAPGRVGPGGHREPDERAPGDAGGRQPAARRRPSRRHRQHRLDRGRQRRARAQPLLGREGRGRDVHARRGARARPARHPREQRVARPHRPAGPGRCVA